MFKVVNGFVCTSGCDVAVARKGVDPRNPHNDPVKQERLDARDPAKAAEQRAEKAAAASGTTPAAPGRLPPVQGAADVIAAPVAGRLIDITV